MKIRLEFKKEDLWVGAFWCTTITKERGKYMDLYERCTDLWICLLPCLPVHLTWTRYI